MAAGTVTMPTSSVEATYEQPAEVVATVNYPAGRFSVAPIFVALPSTTDGTSAYTARHYGNSATGCTVALSTTKGAFTSAITLSWIAVQMTASAAPGELTKRKAK
jgi:predicted porin